MAVVDQHQQVTDYYHRLESRSSYRLLLGGTRHFGYYPQGAGHVPVATALALMEDRLGRALDLPAGSLVLDGGCGQGGVALHLAADFGFRVEGVDLLARDVRRANARAGGRRLAGRARFQVMDYGELRFPGACFDGAYTIETLVHAPDTPAVLAELRRVLRPGGHLALFEYSVAPREELTVRERQLMDAIVAGSAMHSLPGYVGDRLAGLVRGLRGGRDRGHHRADAAHAALAVARAVGALPARQARRAPGPDAELALGRRGPPPPGPVGLQARHRHQARKLGVIRFALAGAAAEPAPKR